MKKLLIYISLFFFLISAGLAQDKQQIPDDKLHKEQFKLDGAWLPDHDPAEIGPSNFSVFKNMRYGPVHPRMVSGYSEINSTPLVTYTYIESGHQLRSDRTQKTYVLVSAKNASGNSATVYQNQTTIPNPGNFEGAPLHVATSDAGTGRFSDAPQGNIAYANEKESYIWGGEETRVAGVLTAEEITGNELILVQADRDFSGATSWTNVDVSSYDESGDLSLTATAAGQSAGLAPEFARMTTGVHSYQIRVTVSNIVDSWYVKDAAGNTILELTSNAGYTFTFWPSAKDIPTTGGLTLEAVTSSSSGDFDNFEIKKKSYDDPLDYTEAANNSLATPGNVVPISGDHLSWYVLTTRPVQGFKYYIGAANTTSSTISCRYWSGAGFSNVGGFNDDTRSGGVSLAQDGVISFTSTAGSAKPFHLEGLYLYAYLFEITGTSSTTTVAHIAADASWQPVKDVWDGVPRQPIEFQVESAGEFEEYTNEVNYESDIQIPIGGVLDGLLTTDNIVIMFSERMAGIRFQMLGALVNTNVSDTEVEYHSGINWVTAGGSVADGTDNADATVGKTGLISWSPPDAADEHPVTLFGTTGYAYRLTFNATLSGTKGVPIAEDAEVLVDLVVGIPAQKTVKAFKFPSMYKNRLLLANYTEGKEANRVDFSMTGAPDVFNGLDSSMDGLQSLYFGNSDGLTAGTQLYNRYGSNVFAIWLALKETSTYILTGENPEDFKIFPVSFTIGCPAPLTLATAEVGFEAVQGIQRNIAIWLSHSGPVMFNGSEVFPIPGINKYFDPTDPDCINFEYIDVARGWYDTTYREYNLQIPSGSSQTTNNVWVAYDMIRKKWFEKDTGTQSVPQAAIQVVDTEGNKYVYGGVDDGYLRRLENGPSWAGTAIDAVVTTGDFWPSKNIWEKSILRQIKIVAKATTPDLDVVHYADTVISGTTIINNESLDASGYRLARITEPLNIAAWSYRFSFQLSSDSVENPFEPIVWGLQWQYVRDDL